MTRDALYQWKSRVLRTVRFLAGEIAADKANRGAPGGGGTGGGAIVLSETMTDPRIVKGAPRS